MHMYNQVNRSNYSSMEYTKMFSICVDNSIITQKKAKKYKGLPAAHKPDGFVFLVFNSQPLNVKLVVNNFII